MAAGNFYVFAIITALVAVNLIFAEDVEREKRSTNEDGEEIHERFFWSFLFPIVTTCNYTTQPGLNCVSCSQAVRCQPNNVGYVTNCRGFRPYCSGGSCSIFPGALCYNATG